MTELRDIQKRALAQIRPTGITALGLPLDQARASWPTRAAMIYGPS